MANGLIIKQANDDIRLKVDFYVKYLHKLYIYFYLIFLFA